MLCSTKELGISDDHEGILVLEPDAPLGRPLAEALGGEVLEFELKANRPDALSVLGIAREAAALYGTQVRSPIPDARPSEDGSGPPVNLQINDPALCARYSAALVRNVRVGESPAWLRDRLEKADVRPISTIVDATNYVMLELGQPLHAFDWDTVRGGFIGVRTARSGERLVTLDGQDRELTPETLCIVDAEGPVALAGVMGGLETEVTDKTSTVLLESATFDPVNIRRTAHRLSLRSEASRRFEKGLPPELTVLALRRCVQLIEEIGAGQGEYLSADAYPAPSDPAPVSLQFDRIERLMGVAYDRAEVRQALNALAFAVEEDGDDLRVSPPFWRRDVTAPADVIEEVARLVGYERIPDTLPTGQVMDLAPGEIDERDDEARDVMVGLGFAECVTYALTSEARMARLVPPDLLDASPDAPLGDADAWAAARESAMNDAGRAVADRLLPLHREPLRLRNPLSMDEYALRLTGLGAMLETLRANRRHADRDLLLFDYQPVFLARDGDLPEEPNFLTAVIGERISADRWNETRAVGLPFLHGVLDELLTRSGVPTVDISHDGTPAPHLRRRRRRVRDPPGLPAGRLRRGERRGRGGLRPGRTRLGAAGGHARRARRLRRPAGLHRLVGLPVRAPRPGHRRGRRGDAGRGVRSHSARRPPAAPVGPLVRRVPRRANSRRQTQPGLRPQLRRPRPHPHRQASRPSTQPGGAGITAPLGAELRA